MGDILEKLECDDCDFDSLARSGNDFDMQQMLKTVCFAEVDSFELCKVVALAGRPFKNVQNEARAMDLLGGASDDALTTLLTTDVGKDDILPLILAQGGGLTTNQMLKKLVVSKTSASLEAQVLTKLLTDTANVNNLVQIA